MTEKKQEEGRAPARREPTWGLDPFDRLRALEGLPRSGWLDEIFGERARMPVPAVDVTEADDAYRVTVELPGIARDDVSVEVHEGMLTIRGEKRSERDEKKEKSRWTERTYGAFSRSFSLPPDADADRIEASCRDGVLRLDIPKTEQPKPRVISVKGS
jgi:HSP20 family protein